MPKSPTKGRRHIHRKIEDDYEMGATVLGEGVTGEVVKAWSKSKSFSQVARPAYAVKTIHLVGAEAIKLERMRREVDVLMRVDHPHIARIDDVYETGEATHLVMECCEGGDVCDRYNAIGRFSEEDAASTIRQMLLAIQYLHNQGIAHCDIKMEHFMYISKESSVLKLIDFGLCQRWEADMPNLIDPVGSFGWVAPEVLGRSYTNKCDLWGLGCIAFNLIMGFKPFNSEVSKENFQALRKGIYRTKEAMWSKVSEEAGDFIRKLLEVDPDRRPTAQEALKHPWMASRQFGGTLLTANDIVVPFRNFCRESSLTKFCLRAMARTIPREEEDQLRDTFIAMDLDKKGTLSRNEILAYTADSDIENPDIANCFEALKVDSRGEVHYSEFIAAMISPQLSTDDPMYKAAVERYCGVLMDDHMTMLMGGDTGTAPRTTSRRSSASTTASTETSPTSWKSKDSVSWQKMKSMLKFLKF
jgi:calcium-dependent protein kinase